MPKSAKDLPTLPLGEDAPSSPSPLAEGKSSPPLPLRERAGERGDPDPYHLAELAARQARALEMGGEDKIARQHAKNRLTARERIAKLLDPNSFDEQGLLAHSDLPEAADKTPADGKIAGFGAIEGRTVFIGADDVTVLAGAGGRVGVGKLMKGMKYAADKGYPCIQLGDAGGARVPDIMGSAGMMSMVYPIKDTEPRNRRVPLITAIMGECFGGSAWTASLSDIVIQVKGTALCVGGPSILEIATGEKASTEELGGWKLHATQTGQVDLFAENDDECLALIRKALSYFPNNSNELPPVLRSPDPRPTLQEKREQRWENEGGATASVVSAPSSVIPTSNSVIPAKAGTQFQTNPSEAMTPSSLNRIDNILDLVPSDPRAVYDMHKVIDAIFDPDSILELKPFYDGSLITALARLDGHVVGVLANNPKVTAGAMGPGACEKAVSFICLCDSFHIPLVFLHDTPGFFVGKRAEEGAMPLRIMNWIEALHQSTVPRISVIIRKSYGMAHCNMAGGNMGCDALLAWSTADVSFMAPAVAVNVVYGRKLAAEPSSSVILSEAKDLAGEGANVLSRDTLMDSISRANAPWEAAGRNCIDKVIDPRDTRIELVRAMERARGDVQVVRSKRNLANWPRMA